MVAILINEFLKVTVKSSGAELVSIKSTFKNKEYLWQGDPKFWARRAPVLFPIVGKVNGNKYRFEGKEYELPQHGFARDMIFDLIDQQDTSLTFILKSNDQTLAVYPFRFELIVNYRLEKNRVIVNYQVKNTDDQTIFFSIGAHPAFNCPLESNETLNDYIIEFEKEETVNRVVLEEGLITQQTESFLKNEKSFSLSEELFDKDAIILKNARSSQVSLKSKKSGHKITVDYTGFPYIAFWTKKGGAPFVCIEPWYGIADNAGFNGALNEKEGIKPLAKGKTFESEFTIEITSPK